jgi:hypothetical protein
MMDGRRNERDMKAFMNRSTDRGEETPKEP